MKRQTRLFCLVAALLAVCYLFTACGKSDGGANGSYAPGDAGNPDIKSETISEDRKIVVRADYSIETLKFDETLRQIETATVQTGGYVSESRVSPAYDGARGHAMLTLRIPASEADGFVTTLSGIGNVTSANVRKTDVTLTYDDVSARVAVLRAEQAKLLELLQSSSGVTETIEIEKRYSEVTQELSSYERQLNSLENAVSYATFTVSLYDVKSYSDGEDPYIVRFGKSFGKSFVSFAKVLGNVLIVLVYLLPYALIVAAVIVLVVVITRKNRKWKNIHQPTPPTQGGAMPMRFGAPDGSAPASPAPPDDGNQDPPARETPADGTTQEGDAV